MSKIQSFHSELSKPSQTLDRKLLVVLQRLIRILQNNIVENGSFIPTDQKYQKSDSFCKIIDYFMLEVDDKFKEEKSKMCQKYIELKYILLNYLKITPQLLEFFCQKAVLKINKGKFDLSMVLHLSKNISKSKNFAKSQVKTIKKIESSVKHKQENVDEKEIKKQFKVEKQMPTFEDEKQLKFQKNVKLSFQEEVVTKREQVQLKSEEIDNSKGMWSPCIQQQYNQLFFPQYYYYSME